MMASLKDIVGSVMRDFISAQHEADAFAMKLASSYRDLKQSSSPVPSSVCIGQVEMTLHCAFTGKESRTECHLIDTLALMRFIRKISDSVPEAVLGCAFSAANGLKDNPVLQMHRDPVRRKDFVSFLRQSIYRYLKRNSSRYMGMDGQVDRTALLENILYVVDDRFVSHPELQDVFGDNGGTPQTDQLAKAVSEAIGAVLDKALEGASFIRKDTCMSMEVSVSPDDLSSVPESCVQTFKLTFAGKSILQDNDM